MTFRLLEALRNHVSRVFSRGYKNHISSPTHSPGFILFDNFEELTVKSPINEALPAGLSALIDTSKPSFNRILPSLKVLRSGISEFEISKCS